MSGALALVSHALCPYVQRAAIVLLEKGVPFARRDVDLANKPGWFLAVSPLGKTPVLLTGEGPVFESSAICEFLEDTVLPRLHPADPLRRARHRGWMAVGEAALGDLAALYRAPDEPTLQQRAHALHRRFVQVEAACDDHGPFFDGAAPGLVDATFAPVFRYVDVMDAQAGTGLVRGLPRIARWRDALRRRPSVAASVGPDHADRLARFLAATGGALAARMMATPTAT